MRDQTVRAPIRFKPAHLFAHFVLLGGGLILLYPLIYMFMMGFFTAEEYAVTQSTLFPIPEHVTFDNYMALIQGSSEVNMQKYLANSVIRTVYSLGWAVLTAFLGGYVFGRLRFKGREKLFLFLLATQMIPGTVALIPTYIEFARWPFAGGNNIFLGGKGILDSWWIYTIGGPALNIMGAFLVKQSLEKISFELDEAAKVDGASTLRIIFGILMPLQMPIIAFIAITTALRVWNDWETPFFFTSSDSLQTIPAAISRLTAIANSFVGIPNYPLIVTLGLGVTIPALLIFFVFQRYIVQGLANTGIKG